MSPSARPEAAFADFDWEAAHRVPIQMRYADLDTLGHLNNAVYVQYFETARVRLTEALEIPPHLDRSVIARLEIDYRREVRWGQEVIVETLIERLGRTSWTTVARLLADGEVCTLARTVEVRVPEGGLTPTPLEDELRARLERLLARPRPAAAVGANVGES